VARVWSPEPELASNYDLRETDQLAAIEKDVARDEARLYRSIELPTRQAQPEGRLFDGIEVFGRIFDHGLLWVGGTESAA
jgi:hypothetical protein